MTHTPHDALFKAVFSSPEHAEAELRAVLPPRLSRRIDWSTLALVTSPPRPRGALPDDARGAGALAAP
jgi:hypothetical protein